MIRSQARESSAGAGPLKRAILGGLVGVILPTGVLAWSIIMARYFPDWSRCGPYIGCAGNLFLAWGYGRWIAVALAWPLLYLLRVRPAWPAAVVGAVFLSGIWEFTAVSIAPGGGPSPFAFELILLAVFGSTPAYALAALATGPRLSRPARILIAVPFLALYVIAVLPIWPTD